MDFGIDEIDDDDASGDPGSAERRLLDAIDEEVALGKRSSKPPLAEAFQAATPRIKSVAPKRKRDDDEEPGAGRSELERAALGLPA